MNTFNKIFYTKEKGKTIRTSYKWKYNSCWEERFCDICSAFPQCKGNKNTFYGEVTTDDTIAWYEGLLCERKGYFTEIIEREEITEGERRLVTTNKSISVRDIVYSFCRGFCPLKQKDLICKDTKECPFHEQLKNNVEIFTYDKR